MLASRAFRPCCSMKVTVKVIRLGAELCSLEFPMELGEQDIGPEGWSEAVCAAAQACKSSSFVNDALLDDDTIIQFSVERRQ